MIATPAEDMTWIAILTLGFVLGLRHATDADHVVAVSTIVGRERNPRAALAVGALWGLGHTVTVTLVGCAIVLLGVVIPPRLGLSMEMTVAVMLVVLGGMNVATSLQRSPLAVTDGGELEHGSSAAATPEARPARGAVRPVVVGAVHGLAGSAGLALLVLATIRDTLGAVLYMAVFSAGTICGMTLLTSVWAVPLYMASSRWRARTLAIEEALGRLTGLVSIGFGLFLFYQIGFVNGLFTSSPSWTPH